MTDQENEPTTLAERLWPDIDPEEYQEDSTPSEATDAAVSASIGTGKVDRSLDLTRRKERLWKAWRTAWNQRGSTDSMDSLEERTARTAFEQWWEKDA